MSRLYERYKKEIVPVLAREFGYKNYLAVPRLEKVVVHVGVGEATADPKIIDKVIEYLAVITGQKGIPMKAKRSEAGFRLRAGQLIGVKVTLRGKRMYEFLDKLFRIVLPRTRDFRGVSPTSFDSLGNYTLGIAEQLVFPEVSYEQIDKIRGLEITIVTTTKEREEAQKLLELLGMPFKKN